MSDKKLQKTLGKLDAKLARLQTVAQKQNEVLVEARETVADLLAEVSQEEPEN